jgi:uncharacterized protein (TIGR00288 family)
MHDQQQRTERRIAILIDSENVGLNILQSLFDQIKQEGRIIIKRAYADWSRASKNRDELFELGIEPVQLLRSSSSRKNSNDILLAIDAIDLLHSSPIDIFVIVSSDSDFIPLINKLRAHGKIVFCACEHSKMSSTLLKTCDKYFYIDQGESANRATQIPLTNEKERQSLSLPLETASINQTDNLWEQIDSAWSKRATTSGKSIPGPNAAADAVKIIGVAKLSASQYKNLDGILEKSALLLKKWLRQGNTIVRR